MNRKLMTERQAWLYLARCWDRPFAQPRLAGERVSVGVLIQDTVTHGLCHSIWRLMYRPGGHINGDTRRKMSDRLYRAYPYREGYFWPRTMRGAVTRAKVCRRFAKEAAAPWEE